MDDARFTDMLSRRSALLLAAAASRLLGQEGGKSMGRPVIHFEIGCRDRAKTGDFYAKLFGWDITSAGPASTIQTGSPLGIPGHITALGHEPEHYTMFYVDVEDVAASLAQAVELGGKKLVGPIPTPVGTFAWFADPDGNMIGLLKPVRPA
jgi:predicted enzyme related to lactoylglutathione lyase